MRTCAFAIATAVLLAFPASTFAHSMEIDPGGRRPIRDRPRIDPMPKEPPFFERYRPSIWLITAALIVSATQMRPSLGSLVAIIIQAALLFLARYVAMREKEGRE